MSTTTLTGQERVQRMFARQDHDRVPRHESFWKETITRWQAEGLSGGYDEALDFLGTDLHEMGWIWPKPYPDTRQVVSADEQTEVIRDGHGKLVRLWKDKSGTPDHLGFGCDDRDKWERIYKPAMLATGLQIDPARFARAYRTGRERGRWCFIACVEGFEETRALLGDEIALMGMAEDPEWIRDVSRIFVDQTMRNLDAVMATGVQPDGLWVYGDMAYNHATVCSPDMYRQLLWPDHKRLAEWAHAHNMKCIFHTDGDVRSVIDLYIAAGFDCLQPLEAKANMDLRSLAPRYNRELAFFGNVDARVLSTNDRGQIEREIRAKLAAGMAGKGYIFHSDHSVPPTVSWPSYQFAVELAEKYGRYE